MLRGENELIIFSDEIYDRLVMDGLEHIAIASLAPDVPCVTFNGLSKSHRVAGLPLRVDVFKRRQKENAGVY